MSAKGPASGSPPTLGQRVWKELRQNWWLWGSVVFAILLVGGLVLFRNQLYDTASHGLPFLAGDTLPQHPFPLHARALNTLHCVHQQFKHPDDQVQSNTIAGSVCLNQLKLAFLTWGITVVLQ